MRQKIGFRQFIPRHFTTTCHNWRYHNKYIYFLNIFWCSPFGHLYFSYVSTMNQNWVPDLTPFPFSILDETRFEPTTFQSWVEFGNHQTGQSPFTTLSLFLIIVEYLYQHFPIKIVAINKTVKSQIINSKQLNGYLKIVVIQVLCMTHFYELISLQFLLNFRLKFYSYTNWMIIFRNFSSKRRKWIFQKKFVKRRQIIFIVLSQVVFPYFNRSTISQW